MTEGLDQVATSPVSIVRQVLVVDDTPANLVAFEAALEPTGCAVVKAASGEEALACLLERDFSLVLLDVNMPGMDGFETARWIRSRERSAHVPIIFISAFSHGDEALLRAYELGAVDFLFKPVYPQVLRTKVQFFIELQAHQEEVIALRLEREYEVKTRAYEARALTREMEANEELGRLNTALRAVDRTKDRFIAGLAHELRHVISDTANADRQIQIIGQLADDLLELSRLGSKQVEFQLAPLELRGVVEQAVGKARVDGKELVVKLGDQPIMVNADRERLVQAITNLVVDAARHTPERGRIGVACLVDPRSAIVIVEDNGLGISPEMLPEIFAGPRIGLALAHRLVAHHKGVLTASSGGLNQGTTFTLKLPIA